MERKETKTQKVIPKILNNSVKTFRMNKYV